MSFSCSSVASYGMFPTAETDGATGQRGVYRPRRRGGETRRPPACPCPSVPLSLCRSRSRPAASPNTERRDRSTAGSRTDNPAIAPPAPLPVRAAAVPPLPLPPPTAGQRRFQKALRRETRHRRQRGGGVVTPWDPRWGGRGLGDPPALRAASGHSGQPRGLGDPPAPGGASVRPRGLRDAASGSGPEAQPLASLTPPGARQDGRHGRAHGCPHGCPRAGHRAEVRPAPQVRGSGDGSPVALRRDGAGPAGQPEALGLGGLSAPGRAGSVWNRSGSWTGATGCSGCRGAAWPCRCCRTSSPSSACPRRCRASCSGSR